MTIYQKRSAILIGISVAGVLVLGYFGTRDDPSRFLVILAVLGGAALLLVILAHFGGKEGEGFRWEAERMGFHSYDTFFKGRAAGTDLLLYRYCHTRTKSYAISHTVACFWVGDRKVESRRNTLSNRRGWSVEEEGGWLMIKWCRQGLLSALVHPQSS